jgi:hypothetical protein
MWFSFSPTFEESFLHHMRTIPWLRSCGQSVTAALPYPIAQATSWSQVERSCGDKEWSNLQIDRQNALSGFLHHNANRKFQRWNSIVDEAKEIFLLPVSEQQWQPLLRTSGAGKQTLASIRWDVLGMFIEHA